MPGFSMAIATWKPSPVMRPACSMHATSSALLRARICSSTCERSTMPQPGTRSHTRRKASRSALTGAVCVASGISSDIWRARRAASSSCMGSMLLRKMVSMPVRARSSLPISGRKPSHFSRSGFSGRRNSCTRRAGFGLRGSSSSDAPDSSVMPVRYSKCADARNGVCRLGSASPANTRPTEPSSTFSRFARRFANSMAPIAGGLASAVAAREALEVRAVRRRMLVRAMARRVSESPRPTPPFTHAAARSLRPAFASNRPA